MNGDTEFDPGAAATSDSGLFGLPYSAEQSLLHVIPVPWEVTTSYGDGASRGPAAILRASHQVDLFDLETGDAYRNGFYLAPLSKDISRWNDEFKAKAKRVLKLVDESKEKTAEADQLRSEINQASERVNDIVYAQAKAILAQGKFAALVGGDHSTPFGLIRALSEKYVGDYGILHIDAHADLRNAYQGYKYSHASIMFNVLEELRPQALVQVGIRDFSSDEYQITEKDSRVFTFFDAVLKRRQYKGETWQKVCDDIVAKLPKQVYISFDIDGLSPDLCPHTGTPVPGGLAFAEVLTLFATVVESGRRIIGFDLNEVAEPEHADGDWDGNVGARILFKMCGWLMVSNGK